MVRKFLEKYSDYGSDMSDEQKEERLSTLRAFIENEVAKFVKDKRITQSNLVELDGKIAYEAYLKDKKEAILKDRKEEKLPDDNVSHVEQVVKRYAGI